MKILTPQQIGLPEKFSSWRPVQENALDVTITNKKRVTSLCVPTGGGKSAIVVALALLSNVPTCIVTYSRGLQKQYMDDFESIGMASIMGRKNYTCSMKEDYTCDEGYASRCPYKGTIACPSSQAEMRAATSSLVVTNYDKWIAARKFGQGMQHFKQVIFDEGHSAPGALSRAMQVFLNCKEIEDKLRVAFPRAGREDFATWRIWARGAWSSAKISMQVAHARIEGLSNPKTSWVKHYTHMRNLCRRLAILATARSTDWVVEEIEQGFQFDPVRPGRYAESTLLLRVPKIAILSATLRPKTMFMIGIGKDNFHFQEFDSDFNPARCPIYYIPTMRVNWANRNNMHSLWIKLDQIAAKRRNVKGIVQTVSFMRQQDVISSSRFSDYMLINEKGEPPTDVIVTYKNSGPGTILVSPSVGTGYDFPGDDARWNFLCKIPFEPASKIVKAREQDDPEYRPYSAMQGMVQAFGRIIRSREDWGENFICDEQLNWFLPRHGHLAPKSFFKFLKQVDIVPQPLRI